MTDRGNRSFPDRQVKARDWQAVYGSLVMILLVFFVLLVSQSHLGDGGMRRLQRALGGGGKKAEPAGVPVNHDPATSWRTVMPDAVVERYGAGVKATFDGNAFFLPGDTQLLPAARFVLGELILQARRFQTNIDVTVVAGCLAGAEGGGQVAWEMAIRRASALHRYLSDEGGLPTGRVYTVARGAACAPSRAGRLTGNGNVIVVLQ